MGWLDRFRRSAAANPPRPATPDPMAVALAASRRGDYDTAFALWEPLARAGVARAQNNIGACFAEGLGVPADPALALRWLTLSAEAGDPVGQRNAAALLLRAPEGVEADHARAAALYRQAAEAGDAMAQDMLSWMLLEGEVMPEDVGEARRWAEAAAAGGVAAAMTRLGLLHHNARGVPRDPEAAARWWGLAAAGGDADGQAMLGAALLMGTGVAPDGVEALAMLLRAQAGGSALATPFLPAARVALGPVEVAEAERRAAAPPSEAEPFAPPAPRSQEAT